MHHNLRVVESYQRPFFDLVATSYLQCEPWVLDWIFAFEGAIELPATAGPCGGSGFARPPRHRRAVYFSPTMDQSWGPGGVVCIKGSEPLCVDLKERLAVLAHEGPNETGFRLAEHFPLVEDKAPLALTRAEALSEASVALDLHRRFQYAGLPMPLIPFPIAVLRHSEETVAAYLNYCRTILDDEVAARIELLASEGLYCFISYHPLASMRVADLLSTISGGVLAASNRQVLSGLPVEASLEIWFRMFADMLSLGIVPASRFNRFKGSCFDLNNAVIGGGVADLGSCRIISSFKSRHDAFEAISISTGVLAATARQLLFGMRLSFRAERYVMDIVNIALREAIKRRLQAASHPVEPMTAEFFSDQRPNLVEFFVTYVS